MSRMTRSLFRTSLTASVLGVAVALTVAGTESCSATTTSAVTNDLGPVASCALPIIVNGLVSGTEIQSLIDLALQCGGATVAGLIALVNDLESPPAVDASSAPVPPAAAALAGYRVQLAALHSALLARQVGGQK